ncbi:MAG: efflux RND transporter periplasmic adaptor subunit [Gracilimonas sp.]
MKLTQMKSQILVLSLLLFMTGCGNGSGDENGENGTTRTTPVYVQELEPTRFQHFINIQGDVESDKTIMITQKATATVEEILVRAGDDVQKGDVLAKLDGEVTRTQIQEVETQLELAKTLFERQQNLREQNIGSEVEFLQSKTQYESAKNQLATLTEQYENYTIRATISGTVDRVDLKVGETVGPNEPVFQLANSDALKVMAQISEAYISRIDQTDSVRISFPSLDENISKRLDVVSKVINPSNRTFGVEIYIPNASGNIRPNMMAKVMINDISLQDQIVVPANTVQKANEVSYVFLAEETEDGWIASNREVTLGYNYNNDLVITGGLESGDLLITDGYADLSDGAAISIQEN